MATRPADRPLTEAVGGLSGLVDRISPTSTAVLIVEDDRNIATVLSIVLENENFDVSWVTSIRAAEEHLASRDVVVALVDRRLEDGDGLTLVERIHACPASRVIVMSGLTGPDDYRAALAAGADDVLEKPFSNADLLASVHRLAAAALARREVLSRPLEGRCRQPLETVAVHPMTAEG